jgi:uncharacterized protein YggE
MRVVITGLALTLAVPLLGGDVGAQPVTTAALAANEVLLEVNATGSVTTPADLVTIQMQVSASGATEAEARSNADALVRRITQAARAAGIPAADIEAGQINTMSDMMMMDTNMAMTADSMENSADMYASNDMAMTQGESVTSANGMVEIRLRDVGRLDAVTRALGEAGGYVLPLPVYSLAESAGPRREARTRALAAARADAEAYAAALGMRVARVVRVTERAGMDWFSMMMNESAMRRAMNGGAQNEPEIETTMMLGVDFALAPR